MRKRFMVALLPLLLAVLLCPLSGAKAETAPYFTFSLDRAEASAGDLVRVRVQARAASEPAAGFRARVFYDSDSLSFVGTESSAVIQSGTLETNSVSNPVCCVYVCNTDRKTAPSLTGNVLTFVFRVCSGAKAGKSAVTAEVDQICGYDGASLASGCEGDMQFRIQRASSSQAALRDLEPSQGSLSPDFSPDVHDYEMWVSSDVDSVTFSADAFDGGTVKISRRSLHAAGSDTLIVITVTSGDGDSKAVYQVTVHREEAPQSSKPESRASVSGSASGTRKGRTGSSARPRRAAGTVSGREAQAPWDTASENEAVSPAQTEKSPESTQTEAVSTAGYAVASPTQAAGPSDTVRVELVQNRMPSFFTGMLAAALCATVGIALNLWFSSGKQKKQ